MKKLRRTKSLVRTWGFRVARRLWHNAAQCEDEPILILGNQKSGTSAIAGLLAARTGQSVQIDFPDINFFLDDIENNSLSLAEYQGYRRRKIIKEPNFTFVPDAAIGLLRPRSVVMVVRHPVNNLRSIFSRLSLSGLHTVSVLHDLHSVPHIWSSILAGRWTPMGECITETLAIRWAMAATAYLENASEWVVVRYEDFVRNKQVVIDRLANELQLSPVKDISHLLNHQFQPKGVVSAGFFSRRNVNVISSRCDKLAKEFGYHVYEPA